MRQYRNELDTLYLTDDLVFDFLQRNIVKQHYDGDDFYKFTIGLISMSQHTRCNGNGIIERPIQS